MDIRQRNKQFETQRRASIDHESFTRRRPGAFREKKDRFDTGAGTSGSGAGTPTETGAGTPTETQAEYKQADEQGDDAQSNDK